MEYGIDYILKLPTEDIKTYLESASIIDILAIIENIKKRTEMDYVSLKKLEKIEEQIKLNKESLTDIEKRINFATKTNASRDEIDMHWENFRRYDAIIDDLTSKKEQLIQDFNDKKQSIFTLAWNMILEAPISKLEDYRNSLITWLKNRIEAIETSKSNREITTNTLLEERNFTKEDITVKSIEAEIKAMEDQVLNHELILNDETIGKIKSLRAKKDSLEHETFTFVCTEKLKTTLKSISNDITKLQMELANIIQMNIESLKEMILSDYAQGKEEIKLANYVRIYRSYLENISKVKLPLKADYRNICSTYASLLNSIENPSYEGETLSDLDAKLKELHNYIKTLEQYKTRKVDKEVESKFLYSTVRQQGLFELPFSKEKWLSYFGKYFETLINDIKALEEKNKEYISLSQVTLKSKKIEEELAEYRKDLRSMLDELYNKVLSLYLKSNLYINVNIYDYRDTETFAKYLEYRDISIDKEIASVNAAIEELNQKKSSVLEFINDTYTKIDTEIKAKLNSIFNGTYVKEEEKEEKPHHFFSSPVTLETGYEADNVGLSFTDLAKDTTDRALSLDSNTTSNEFNPFFRDNETSTYEIPSRNKRNTYFGTSNFENEFFRSSAVKEEKTDYEAEDESKQELPVTEETEVEPVAKESEVTTFNPDDIFGSSASNEENKTEEETHSDSKVSSTHSIFDNDDTVISFESDKELDAKGETKEKENEASKSDDINFDDDITPSDRKAFKELLEPQEVPDFNAVINDTVEKEESKEEQPETKKKTKAQAKKRGLKVIKQEAVVSKKTSKKTEEKKETKKESTSVKTDATEIKERIEHSQTDRQNKPVPPLFNPASASDVNGEYNDTNAPIDLNAYLNGNLANKQSSKETTNALSKEPEETKEEQPKDKKLTLSPDDNINLMDFLSQIENHDSKVA